MSRLSLFMTSLAIFTASSCGKKGGSKDTDNTAPLPSSLNGKPVVFSDFVTSPAVVTLNTNGTLDSVRAFRFEVKQNSTFAVSAISIGANDCNGDAQVRLHLKSMLNKNEFRSEKGTELKTSTKVDLVPGFYAVTVDANSSVTCAELKVSIVAAAKEKAGQTNTSPGQPSDDARAKQPGSMTPAEIEALRIQQGKVKADTSIEFLAHASKSQGCVPVFSRNMQALKKEAGVAEQSTSLVTASIVKEGGSDYSVTLTREAETANDVQLASLGPSAMNLLKFEIMERSDFDSSWLDKLRSDIVEKGGKIQFALDSECEKNGVFLIKNLDALRSIPRSFKGTTMSDQQFPLALRKDSNGLATPEMRLTYAYASPESSDLQLDMKFDLAKILPQVGFVENVSSVSWILGNNATGNPMSDWTSLPVNEFFTPTGSVKVKIADGKLATRALYKFLQKSFVFKVTVKDTSPIVDDQFYVVAPGYFCELTYRRPDAAAFHQSIFADLTNSSWNANPSRDLKQGCAYVGEAWW